MCQFNTKFTNLSAENPPKIAPEAIPTQKPIMAPIFIRSKQDGPCWPYMFPGTAGILILFGFDLKRRCNIDYIFKGKDSSMELTDDSNNLKNVIKS